MWKTEETPKFVKVAQFYKETRSDSVRRSARFDFSLRFFVRLDSHDLRNASGKRRFSGAFSIKNPSPGDVRTVFTATGREPGLGVAGNRLTEG